MVWNVGIWTFLRSLAGQRTELTPGGNGLSVQILTMGYGNIVVRLLVFPSCLSSAVMLFLFLLCSSTQKQDEPLRGNSESTWLKENRKHNRGLRFWYYVVSNKWPHIAVVKVRTLIPGQELLPNVDSNRVLETTGGGSPCVWHCGSSWGDRRSIIFWPLRVLHSFREQSKSSCAQMNSWLLGSIGVLQKERDSD